MDKMRTGVILSCLFAVCCGFSAKRLLLDLAELKARELTPNLSESIGSAAQALLSRANSQLQKKSNSGEVEFAEFVLRTARELSKDKFQAEMIQVCEGKDTNAYRNAQAVANDIVFEYQDELPQNTDDPCLVAAVYYNMRLRADILSIKSGIPDICNEDYPGKEVDGKPNGKPWIGKDTFCPGFEKKNNAQNV